MIKPCPFWKVFNKLFITLVQRYTKYILILIEIEKHTLHFGPDKLYLIHVQIKTIKLSKELEEISRNSNYSQISLIVVAFRVILAHSIIMLNCFFLMKFKSLENLKLMGLFH
jgi:hypothetical protein